MSDEIIWQCINQQFCAYKVKAPSLTFCRNEYNVSGLCNRQSCPLANSRYATVREKEGRLYLYMKTVERSHLPAKLWERIKLSKNYAEALKQIDDRLQYWPNFTTHKCKQRLTKLTQYLIKSRKLALTPQVKMIPIKPKQTKREAAREWKAFIAAKIEKSIEKELVERLKSGLYGEQPLNVNEDVWQKFLDSKNMQMEDQLSDAEEELQEEEFIEESDNEVEDIEDWWTQNEGDSQASESVTQSSESESETDVEESSRLKRKAKTPRGSSLKKRPRTMEIEYEEELEPESREALHAR